MKRGMLAGALLLAALLARPIDAQAPAPMGKPFGLPFAEPSGPTTWYLGQGYGNTIGAYFQRDTTYRAGQGLHFGLHFAAPCGTTFVATLARVFAENGKKVIAIDADPVANLAVTLGIKNVS